MTALQRTEPALFQFETHQVRAIVGENGEPLFIGNDVCKALGYVDPTSAMRHCRGAQKLHPIQTAGGIQAIRVLSEADVMRLIVKAKLPAAQAFERFVFDEVLPAMRKNIHQGDPQSVETQRTASNFASHPVPPMVAHRSAPPSVAGLPDFTDRVAAARAWADAEEGRLDLVAKVARLERQVADQAPAVAALNLIASSDGAMCMRDAAKVLQIQYRELEGLMVENGWIYRRPGQTRYLARQDKLQSGYLAHKIGTYEDPKSKEHKTKEQVQVTQRGITRLACMLSMKKATAPPQTMSPNQI